MIKNYCELSIEQLHDLLVKKEVTPLMLAQQAIALAKLDKSNAIEYLMEKEALEFAKTLSEPEVDNMLWGIPFIIKDNFSTKNVPTCASSNVLSGYVPVYDATVIRKLKEKKAVAICKTTLDELAMGGTGTTGHLGVTFNPHDKTHSRLVGGSSCGSAALTAAGVVPFALGSDTGDSVRKPASYAGLVGLKPTWSRISRFGLFPFAPSLDTVGFFTRNVADLSYLLEATAGRDDNDSTSSSRLVDNYHDQINKPIKGFKVAVINQILQVIKDQDIKNSFTKTIEDLRQKGVVVDYVDMDMSILSSLYPTYFVISCAEATSNNANLDGIKFGPYYDAKSYEEVMMNARTKGFSKFIKRRFVFGSFALMSENQNDLFIRAQKNRRRIVEAVNKILENYDFIYLPAAPSIAPKFTDKSDVLSDEYLIADNHLCIGNFTGLPSLTLPIGKKEGMPFGANITGRAFEEGKVLQICSAIEETTGLKGLYAKGE